jgi:two-component sensor histidine kinase
MMTDLSNNQCNIFSTCRKNHRAAAAAPVAGSQQETDHRIANGVQFAAALLRHESRRITSVSEARDALTRTADRLSAIAHLHRQLSLAQPECKVEFTAFIRPFCKDISVSTGVIFDLEPNAVKLRADVAAQICIILNELATNAQKHGARDGGPVIMTLKVMRDGADRVRLVLRDNGCGLPEGFSIHDLSGLGMTIVTSTVEKLGGHIHVLPGEGAGFGIDLPVDSGAPGSGRSFERVG